MPTKRYSIKLHLVFLVCFCFLGSIRFVGAEDQPRERQIPISLRSLIESSSTLDGKRVWVLGKVLTDGDAIYLTSLVGGKPAASVCLAPSPSYSDPSGAVEKTVLRRLAGVTPVAVHGLYERFAGPQCPNGRLLASSLQIELN